MNRDNMVSDNFWKIFTFLFIFNRLVWWVGGVDIFSRGVSNAMAIVFSLIVAYSLVGMLLVVERDK